MVDLIAETRRRDRGTDGSNGPGISLLPARVDDRRGLRRHRRRRGLAARARAAGYADDVVAIEASIAEERADLIELGAEGDAGRIEASAMRPGTEFIRFGGGLLGSFWIEVDSN